jgi:hypothetical protein
MVFLREMAKLPFQRRAMMDHTKGLGLIRGAKNLAAFIFDDVTEVKKVYPLKTELGLFRLNGMICGRPDTIRERIAAREGRDSKAA